MNYPIVWYFAYCHSFEHRKYFPYLLLLIYAKSICVVIVSELLMFIVIPAIAILNSFVLRWYILHVSRYLVHHTCICCVFSMNTKNCVMCDIETDYRIIFIRVPSLICDAAVSLWDWASFRFSTFNKQKLINRIIFFIISSTIKNCSKLSGDKMWTTMNTNMPPGRKEEWIKKVAVADADEISNQACHDEQLET